MYEGRTDFETGRWFGHENLGQVVEVGDGVDKVRVGDWVVMPFNIACGHCKNCERQLTNYCLTAQPEAKMAGAAYGFADMGPWAGGQAELLRVPWGDFNCLRLGEDAEQRQTDYVMLADIFPTGYHATEVAGVKRSEEHTSELQSRQYLVCRLLLEKKTTKYLNTMFTRIYKNLFTSLSTIFLYYIILYTHSIVLCSPVITRYRLSMFQVTVTVI